MRRQVKTNLKPNPSQRMMRSNRAHHAWQRDAVWARYPRWSSIGRWMSCVDVVSWRMRAAQMEREQEDQEEELPTMSYRW